MVMLCTVDAHCVSRANPNIVYRSRKMKQNCHLGQLGLRSQLIEFLHGQFCPIR